MAILVTGGHGMVGTRLQAPKDILLKPTSQEMNICDLNSIRSYIQGRQIQSIIHLASINLRECEANPALALQVNIGGTTNLVQIAQELDIPLLLVSSGAVFATDFDGDHFEESSQPHPSTIYGHTKHQAEMICNLYPKSIIVRTGWLFGGTQKRHYKFVDQVLLNLQMHKVVRASNDFYGSFTYVQDLIDSMFELLETRQYGLHHIANSGRATGYEIASQIASILGADPNLVIPVSASEVPNPGPPRGKSEVLISSKHTLRSYQKALREYIQEVLREAVQECIQSPSEGSSSLWQDRTQCRLCHQDHLFTIFKLEPTPPANHYTKSLELQPRIPLDLAVCQRCLHVQLLQILDPSYLYSDYLYFSGISNSMTTHLQKSVLEFIEETQTTREDAILEIGANDGTCLKHLMQHNYHKIVGVDPAQNINKLVTQEQIPIICDFFGPNIIPQLRDWPKFKLIYAFHCCAHIEKIAEVFETVSHLLNDQGFFIMEVGYFYEVFTQKIFDTVYHEHIDYHTVRALLPFAKSHGLQLYKVRRNQIQGGSIQFYMSKNPDIEIDRSIREHLELESSLTLNALSDWKTSIMQTGRDLNYILSGLKSHGKRLAGFGASAKLTTFCHQYNLNKNLIEYVIDDNIYKQNLYTPGLHMPIRGIEALKFDRVDYIIIFAWNMATEILEKLRPYREHMGLRVIVPFPEIKIC